MQPFFRQRWPSLIAAASSTLAIVFGVLLYLDRSPAARASDAEIYRYFDLFGEVFETVRADYVEPTDDVALIKAAIKGMLSSLDPHSAYLEPDNYRNMQIYTRGEFGGLGLEVTMDQGFVKVIAPIDETPAARAGMLAGDIITHLDGESIQGLTLSEAVEKMRGKKGTAIVLTVRREGADKALKVRIVRAVIKLRSVSARREGRVGYLRVTTFNDQAARALRREIGKLQSERGGVIGYILDLRNNPGGLLDQAVAVADIFLEGGEIVSTRQRDGRAGERYNARRGDLTQGRPVIVLINGGSASASEIVAGALQDQRRAVILGTLSFGKGSVQTIKSLGGDNGALRLTTARYYTPSGQRIQAVGVEPDIVVEQVLTEEEKDKLGITGETDLRGYLDGGESGAGGGGKTRSGSASYIPPERDRDAQLNYALELLRGMDKNGRAAQAAQNR